MRIRSEDVWQADTLADVACAVHAVSRGARTYNDIAGAIGKVDRQGRYYRRAAEILGLIERRSLNDSTLTALGRRFVRSSEPERRRMITQAVFSTRVVQRLLPFLERAGGAGVTRAELTRFLSQVASLGGPSMAPRRIASIVNWLNDLGLTRSIGDRLILGRLPESVSVVNYSTEDEPLFPRRYELAEYEERSRRVRENRGFLNVLIDEAARERARSSHQTLVNLMATRLRDYGAIPRSNRYIDLSANVDSANHLFEMKSTTEHNFTSQIRRGLSQLYEYRYIERLDNCQLVLVLQNPLPRPLGWMDQYLEQDRHVLLVWDGSNRFFASQATRQALPYLQ